MTRLTRHSILTVSLFITVICVKGQVNDFGQIVNKWTEGKIDENGNVVKADIRRGGWYQLNINQDSTVTFGDPFTCGFGRKKEGTWIINKPDTTITFKFIKLTGYMNNPGTTDIEEIEIYKIEKLTVDELILHKTNGKESRTLPFIQTEKIK